MRRFMRWLVGCPNAVACALKPQPRTETRYVYPYRQSGSLDEPDLMADWK